MRQRLGEIIVNFIMRRVQGLMTQGLMTEVRREDGQALVEYALLISLVAIVALVAVSTVGTGVSTLYSKIITNFP
jgi:Flp pilus assembly pilin Flp